MGPTLKEEYTFKVIMLGDTTVGKTSLLYRYTENVYRCTISTVAATCSTHVLELEPDVCVKLNIWDTCGMERYRALTRSYFHNVAGCLLVFDLTNKDSFNNIQKWHDDMCDNQQLNSIVFVLVGQKCDDLDNRNVTQEEAEELAEQLGMPYVETSAVTGHNVKEVFDDLARRIRNEGILSDVSLDNHRVKMTQVTTKNKKKCCS